MAIYTTNYRDSRHLFHKDTKDALKYAYGFVKDTNEFHPHVKVFNSKTGKEIAMVTRSLDGSTVYVEMRTDLTMTTAKLNKDGELYGSSTTDAFLLYAFLYNDTRRRVMSEDFLISLKEARIMCARLSKEKGRAIDVEAVFNWNGRTKLIHVATYRNGKAVGKEASK